MGKKSIFLDLFAEIYYYMKDLLDLLLSGKTRSEVITQRFANILVRRVNSTHFKGGDRI